MSYSKIPVSACLLLLAVVFVPTTSYIKQSGQRYKYSSHEATSVTKLHLDKRSVSSNVRESCQKSEAAPSNRSNRVDTSDRLRRLRLRMKASNYNAYIIPSVDEHQSEFIADHDKRREFITGFTGSEGTAVVLQNGAALWVDGRYFLQAEQELDCNWLLMKQHNEEAPSIDEWITKNLGPNSRVGADPKLIPFSEWLFLKEKFEAVGISFSGDSSNLIDDIWNLPQGRVPESSAHVFIHDAKYTGKTWQEKVKELRDLLEKRNITGTIVTALDEISWLFNLRGSEIVYTPVFKSYAFISEDFLRLYIKPLKLTEEVRRHLGSKGCNHSLCVQIKDYNQVLEDIADLISETQKILVPSLSSYAVSNIIPEKQREIEEGPSPVSTLRAVKNPVEIQGMKNACLKDATAIIDFIAMLDKEVNSGKQWDEIKASKILSKFRSEQELNRGESFSTVSAFGPNGAIIHYIPQVSTNRNINNENLYLLDSGGQYLDGTTDITRTFHFGEPNDFEKEAYTRVLIGVIELTTMVFPNGITDAELDILARRPLYSIGLDYEHGTGHGIGSFLSVHEGPISIGISPDGFALKPGMFMSNEPGFYETGKFGIRLETIMMVVKANTPYQFNNQEYYTFEPISFVPFEPKLINLKLLNEKQKEWLNWFNMKTRNSVGIELRRQKRERGFQWLLSKTEHIPIEGCPNLGVSSNFMNLQIIFLLLITITLINF